MCSFGFVFYAEVIIQTNGDSEPLLPQKRRRYNMSIFPLTVLKNVSKFFWTKITEGPKISKITISSELFSNQDVCHSEQLCKS